MNISLIDKIRERVAFLENMYESIEARNRRIEELKNKNLFIDEAAPKYKENYAKN
jgi:hypothetical protein